MAVNYRICLGSGKRQRTFQGAGKCDGEMTARTLWQIESAVLY